MTTAFWIRLLLFIGLFVAFLVGVLTAQAGLAAAYICLAPWAGLWLGRATVGMFKRSRFAVLTDRELNTLRQMRSKG